MLEEKLLKQSLNGHLVSYLLISIDGSCSSEQVTCVITLKNDQFIDPVHKWFLKVYFNFYFAYLRLYVGYFLPEKHNNYLIEVALAKNENCPTFTLVQLATF